MSNARNLAKVAVDANGDIGTASLDNLTGALGYTPVNKAGDTMTGALVLDTGYQNGLRILRDYDVTVTPAGQAIQFGAKLGGTPVYPIELIGSTDTDGSAYKFEVKMDSTYPFIIDSAGRVTMPYQPAFNAYHSIAQTVTTGSVQFNTALLNRGGCYNATNSRFTAPVGGVYLFRWQLMNSANTSNTQDSRLRVNGGAHSQGGTTYIESGADGTAYRMRTGVNIISLNANDYVEVYTLQSGTFHTTHTVFGGYLIG